MCIIQRLNPRFNGMEGTYSVKKAYDAIIEGWVTEDQWKLVIAWNRLVMLKIVILAWRLLQNRIPSKK